MQCKFKYIGFCGIDSSIDPMLLSLISSKYQYIEWGILFRSNDCKEVLELPRYPGLRWVEKYLYPAYISVRVPKRMNLAAHLCGDYVIDLLKGDDRFVKRLSKLGFKRFQINATKANGVDLSKILLNNDDDIQDDGRFSVVNLLKVIREHPESEFIIQRSDETEKFWKDIQDMNSEQQSVVSNISTLYDPSKGRGIRCTAFPPSNELYATGYAGGIGPDVIIDVMTQIIQANKDISDITRHQYERSEYNYTNKYIWIDMESNIRSICNGNDVFDINKVFSCIQQIEIHMKNSIIDLHE